VVVLPAFAQDNFPDVPDNHWAYEALARMKAEGLLVGYPDGLFRGPRPATRYELAVAVHATYSHLKSLIDGLQSQLDAIKNAPTNNQADIDALKAAVAALQNDVAQIRSQDIADLRRMAETFEKELAALGVDVQQMKRDLGELADRVTNLENRLPVDISGDLNLGFSPRTVTRKTTSWVSTSPAALWAPSVAFSRVPAAITRSTCTTRARSL
jgi:hypothetical protein